MIQQDRLLLAATAWMVAEGLRGYEHDFAVAPDVAGPDALRGTQTFAEWLDALPDA